MDPALVSAEALAAAPQEQAAPQGSNGVSAGAATGAAKSALQSAPNQPAEPSSESPPEPALEPSSEPALETQSEPAGEAPSEPATGEPAAGEAAAEDAADASAEAADSDALAALFGLDAVASMEIYDLGNYTFGKKERDSRCFAMQALAPAKVREHLAARYAERGLRRSVAAVLLVHAHRFPHALLLQRADGRGDYALPGGRLRLGESDEDGLARKLRAKLTPDRRPGEDDAPELDIGDRLSTWYRIDFSRNFYPYIPAHVTKPKEEMHIYTVSLPEKFAFSVPKNMQLVAVPLFDLFDNSATFGNVIASLPALISRFHKNYC